MGGERKRKSRKGGVFTHTPTPLRKRITRRQFLKYSLFGIGAVATGAYILNRPKQEHTVFEGGAPEEAGTYSTEAMYHQTTPLGIRCNLCPHECLLEEGDRGFCRVRANIDGTLYSLAYGNPAAAHVDPIEKKPLLHFHPESSIFSISTGGCNLRCLNCQNWELSQSRPEDITHTNLMPDRVLQAALSNGCDGIAYTYAEPTVFYEYMLETAKKAKKQGFTNVYVTSGYIQDAPLRELAPYLDATNIDLKGFTEESYSKLNAGSLDPVLSSLRILKENNVWIEITNLIVPHWTDDFDMIREMSRWLVKNGFAGYPLHFSRFTPQHKLVHLPPTPKKTLEKARDIAKAEGIRFPYIGNVPGHKGEDTYCPACGKKLMERRGYRILNNNITKGRCAFCNEKIEGVWNDA